VIGNWLHDVRTWRLIERVECRRLDALARTAAKRLESESPIG
jgi:hypothetical protein